MFGSSDEFDALDENRQTAKIGSSCCGSYHAFVPLPAALSYSRSPSQPNPMGFAVSLYATAKLAGIYRLRALAYKKNKE